MSSTSNDPAPSGKRMRPAKGSKRTAPVDLDFAAEWNALDKPTRRQIRRLVRIGRPQENAEDARLAIGFAQYQRSRAWFRHFWLWIVPLMVAGFIAGFAVHPIIIGMMMAAVGNALLVRRAFRKTEWLNEPLIDPTVV